MNTIPFSYETYIPEGDVTFKRASLKGEAIGIDYSNVQQNIVVNVCAIVEYANGKRDQFKTSLNVRKGEAYYIDGESISTAFQSHYLHGHIKYMEFLIIPTGCYPLKWRIKVEE